jgi:MATE family multidrug resistance protein
MRSILLGVGQDPAIVDIAVIYINWCIPGVFFNAFSMQNTLYCANLESTIVTMIQGGVSTISHALLLWLFVGIMGMGFTGLCMASSAQFFTRWLATVAFMKMTSNPKISKQANVPFFCKASISDLGFQAKIAVLQCTMGVWNWWGLEAFVFMSSYVSTTALAAASVLRAISQFTYMIPVGLRLATQIVIGKKIGEMSEPSCRHFYKISMEIGMIYAGVVALLFAILEKPICMIFTRDEAVLLQLQAVWVAFIIFCIVDQVQGVGSSILVAAGKQHLGGIITWIGYCLVGLSAISFNIFIRQSGFVGIWTGATAAVGFNAIAFLLVAATTDWTTLINQAAAKRADLKKQLE